MVSLRLLLLILCLFCSCKKVESRLHYNCDIDLLSPWSDHKSIKPGAAHTGSYVSVADTSFPYCIGFKKKLSEITDGQILRIEFSAWINCPTETAGNFVCVVDSSPGKQFISLYDEIKYDNKKPGKWQKMKSEFYLPKSLGGDYIIQLFIWNTGQGEIIADDIEINFTEY